MRIVHVCLSAPYVDGWGYQENLLPEYLNKLGTENHVITSNDNHPEYLSSEIKNEIISKGEKYKIGKTTIHKIRCKKMTSSVFIPYGLKKKMLEINPDVIFHHNVSITTLLIVSKYAKEHNCKLFVDNHADEINMSKNRLWILAYYKGLSRLACRIRQNTFTRFFGVTHSRCEFINKYYGVPKKYIELLPIGADTDLADTLSSKKILRGKYGFVEDEQIIISGGKMGIHKGTLNLINAIEELGSEKIKLILFGKFEDEDTYKLAESKDFVSIYGWCDRLKTLELLKLADVACWPIHHTTLIEDAIAVETPLIIRKTGTTKHLIKKNGIWLKNGDKDELKKALKEFIDGIKVDCNIYSQECKNIKSLMSYDNIARKVIKRTKYHEDGL